MLSMFLKQNNERSPSGYFPTNCWAQRKQHAKRDEEYAWKRILNFINMQIFLLATNACNYLLYEACNKNKNQQTKHFRQLNQTIWLVCYHMIIGDRSIDNILRGFHSFTNLSDSEYRHKSKMIMLLRDEKSGIKSGNIMKNGKSYLVKEYFKYVFLRIRTITEFHM